MESFKRSLYIVLSILVGIFLIKFMFKIAMYLLPIALIIYGIKKIRTLIKNKVDNKEKIDKVNSFESKIEINEEIEEFSIEDAIEVEYEEVKSDEEESDEV